jgi:hypothetical protein
MQGIGRKKPLMGIASPSPCLPFIPPASKWVFWLFPHKAKKFDTIEWELSKQTVI